MKYVIGLIVAALMYGIYRLRLYEALKRSETGGCVACGSKQVVIEGDERRCTECGYAGRADGGGALTANEFDGIITNPRKKKD